MSVVGFDIGYQSCFIAIARHGGVETISNEYSERASPSLVGLTSSLRTMGTTAKTQQSTNFKNTIGGFKTMIGRKFTDPIAQAEFERQNFAVQQVSNNQIGIKVQYLGEETIFTPVQAMCMMLEYLKNVASKALGKPITDCVISVPSYFTDAQRRAVIDASVIAGLNCLRLMNETTAVALAYGIYKQDLPEEKEKSRNVVFVDMGHHSLQVAVCAFNKGKLKVLSKSFDPMLGGRDFDSKLVGHFAQEFKEKYKVDALTKRKALLRLFTECEKLKKLMSANSTPIPINIECFMDDKDVSGRFTRAEFQELCSDLFVRVKQTLQSALTKSGLTLDDIHSVEVVGGCSRVPAVKEIISSVFQRELSTTMNLDEAVARGCALQCAILSPTFKVRDFSIHDIQPYPIKLTWDNNGEPGEMTVFNEGDQTYHSKLLTFYRKDAFELRAAYLQPDKIHYTDPFIGVFRIEGVKPTEDGDSSKIKIKVRLSTHGTFIIKSATMVEKQTVQVEEVMETDTPADSTTTADTTQAAAADTTSTTTTGEGDTTTTTTPGDTNTAQNGGQSVEGATTGELESEPSDENMDTSPGDSTEQTDSNATGTETQTENGKEADEKAKNSPTKKTKKVYKQVDLPVKEETNSMKKKYIDEAFEKECKMAQQDRLEIEKADAKNSVEEYVYDIRDKIGTIYERFMSEEARDQFRSLLDATEDWLYDEGEDQPKKVYVERLTELKKTGDAVIERERENNLRPRAFEEMGKTIVHLEKIVIAYEAKDEKYDHLTVEDMNKVKEAIEKKRQWMTNQMQACSATPLYNDPPIKVNEILTNMKDLNNVCNPIVNKPKPKVEPPKDEEGAKENDDSKMEEDKTDQVESSETQPPVETTPTTNESTGEDTFADMDVD